jgi:hypothetical protein
MSQENVEAVPQESIALATFKGRFAAERMLASLGRAFRREALAGKANVFVISANADGSLRLTESRAVQAGGLVSTVIRVTGALLAGFTGFFSMLKEAFRIGRATRAGASRVGSDDIRSHEILAQVGPGAAAALVRCRDEEMRHKVSEKAADSAVGTWDGSLAEFLAALDPGSKHDWVRDALGVPPGSGPGDALA